MDIAPTMQTSAAAIAGRGRIVTASGTGMGHARAADEHGYVWSRLAWQRAAAVPGAWFDGRQGRRDHRAPGRHGSS